VLADVTADALKAATDTLATAATPCSP